VAGHRAATALEPPKPVRDRLLAAPCSVIWFDG